MSFKVSQKTKTKQKKNQIKLVKRLKKETDNRLVLVLENWSYSKNYCLLLFLVFTAVCWRVCLLFIPLWTKFDCFSVFFSDDSRCYCSSESHHLEVRKSNRLFFNLGSCLCMCMCVHMCVYVRMCEELNLFFPDLCVWFQHNTISTLLVYSVFFFLLFTALISGDNLSFAHVRLFSDEEMITHILIVGAVVIRKKASDMNV